MNRLGDCICAIPAKPPEEHKHECPVWLRAQTVHTMQHALWDVANWTSLQYAGVELPREQRDELDWVMLSLGRIAGTLQRLFGAGADQAPGRESDARQGAPRRAAAPHVRLVEPSPPNQLSRRDPMQDPTFVGHGGWRPTCIECRRLSHACPEHRTPADDPRPGVTCRTRMAGLKCSLCPDGEALPGGPRRGGP